MTNQTSILAICASLCASGLWAQDTLDTSDIDVIGTVIIGESRRGVQTGTAASRTEIDQEEIEARQATTLGQLMDTIPNVSLINGILPQGSGITIRGLGAQAGVYGTDGKINVVIDGVQSGAEEIYRNGSFLSLEPELFKELNVTRGPADGFRYSGGAVGGTVEATTKDARDFLDDGDTFSFRQKLGYESNGDGMLSTSILSFAPTDRFDLLAFYGYRTADDREDGNGDTLPGTEFRQTSAMLKGNYLLTPASKLSFALIHNEIPERDVFYSAFDPDFSSEKVDRDTEDTTAYVEYNFDSVDSDLINVTARLQYKKEVIDILSLTGATSIFDADHETTTTSLRVTNQAAFNTGALSHDLLAGIEIGERERTSYAEGTSVNDVSAPGGTDDYVALFLSDEIEVSNRLTVTPQARFEKQTLTSQDNDAGFSFGRPVPAIADGTEFKSEALTGALSTHYELTDAVAVFGTVAYNENLPILDDIRGSFAEQSEKARSYEIGMSYDGFDVFADGDVLKAKLTGYHTHIWDVTTYSGVSDVDLWGGELELSYAHPQFYVDANAAISRGSQNEGSAFFSRATGETAQLTVGKRFFDDQLDVNLEAKHAWANDRTTSTSGSLAPTDAFTVYTLSSTYKPNNGPLEGVEINASVENLFDKEYRAYGNTRNGIGRTFKLSLAKTF